VSARGPAALAVLWLVSFCLLACQAIFGDFEVEKASGPSTVEGCDAGRFSCRDALLYCVGTSNGTDELTLLQPCSSAALCDSQQGRCLACQSGDFRCNGARLEKCKADQSAWELSAECANADECNLASRECRACTPGEVQCSGPEQRDLRECGADHGWGAPETCASRELCDASVMAANETTTWNHQCIPPGCGPGGTYSCDGATLRRCPTSQIDWTGHEVCASVELCQSAAADPAGTDARGSHCPTPVCSPAGVYRCDGNTLETCHDDLLGWGFADECMPPLQCNTNAMSCTGPCTPGDMQCSGSFLETCSERQLWDIREPCASGPLCSVTLDSSTQLHVGECSPPVCPTPSAFTCAGAQLLQCAPDQTAWLPVEACDSPALCKEDDARCDPKGCDVAGALRCNAENPRELEVCADDLTGWIPVTTCETTQSCNVDPAGPACIDQCPESPERCNGGTREVCSGVTGAPVWTASAMCQTNDLCECGLGGGECPGGISTMDQICGLPVCGGSLPSARCMGGMLQTCEAGRNGWDDAPCSLGCYDPNGAVEAYCIECSSGDARCVNGQLQHCDGGTRKWGAISGCECLGTSPNAYCAECVEGDTRCQSGDAQTCGMNRTWSGGTTEECGTFGCAGTAPNVYCAECTEAETRCQDDDVQTCGADELWNPTLEDCGALGCEGAAPNVFCAQCANGATQCRDGRLETCADSVWGTGVECDCLGEAPAAYCGECTPGTYDCVTDGMPQIRLCDENSRWQDAPDCTIACVEGTSADYCAECDDVDDCGGNNCVAGLCEVL
jgi:hypothetical protein